MNLYRSLITRCVWSPTDDHGRLRVWVTFLVGAVVVVGMGVSTSRLSAQEVLFEETFDEGLSSKWTLIGLEKSDYRIRNGALELRVAPSHLAETPRLQIDLPFSTDDTVICSVEITVLDEFTNESEAAGIYLTDEHGIEFGAKQQRVGERLVFSPGDYVFRGEPGDEGDVNKYEVKYTDVSPDSGPIRIIARESYAYFQVGPSKDEKYLNFFHSAVNDKPARRGFAIAATGAEAEVEHWVRFDNFRVTR